MMASPLQQQMAMANLANMNTMNPQLVNALVAPWQLMALNNYSIATMAYQQAQAQQTMAGAQPLPHTHQQQTQQQAESSGGDQGQQQQQQQQQTEGGKGADSDI